MIPVVDREDLIREVEGRVQADRAAHRASNPQPETRAPSFRASVVAAYVSAGLPVELAPFPVLAMSHGLPWVLLRFPVWPAMIDAEAPSLSAILCPRALA